MTLIFYQQQSNSLCFICIALAISFSSFLVRCFALWLSSKLRLYLISFPYSCYRHFSSLSSLPFRSLLREYPSPSSTELIVFDTSYPIISASYFLLI